MFYSGAGSSMLMPYLWEPEATETGRVLADQPPGVAGVGAATMAMQALNLTPDQAAALVSSQGGASVSSGQLSGAVKSAAGAANASPAPIAVPSSRLPIAPNVNTVLQFLAGDPDRALLIIQNNEPTGGATLLVSFDPINTGSSAYYLNFGPGGFGILLDRNLPSNPIYVAWSGNATVGGMIMYGSKSPTPAASAGAIAPAGGYSAGGGAPALSRSPFFSS